MRHRQIDPETTIYSASGRRGSFASVAKSMLRDLRNAHGLARELALRDIKAQYRQAAFGLLWMLIVPLANIVVWLFIRSSGAITIDVPVVSYPVFVISGTLLWSIFLDAANAPLQQVLGASQMLAKINFPREALILSGLYQSSIAAIIKVAILIGALAMLGVRPDLPLLALPLAILGLITFGTLLGLAITPVGALYSDVGRGIPILLQFLMYLAPVVYAAPKTGWAAHVMGNNPLTPVIDLGRSAAVGMPLSGVAETVFATGVAFVLILAAWFIYRMAMPILIERMSA